MKNLPEDNLAYSVLLRFDTGARGSGFFLNTTPELPFYLVSAKHVLFDNEGNLRGKFLEIICLPKLQNQTGHFAFQIDLSKVKSIKHKDADVAAIYLGERIQDIKSSLYNVSFFKGVDLTQSTEGSTISVSANDHVKLLADVSISNDVFVQGYPSSLGLSSSPQFDYEKPLLRKGIVANVYPKQGTIIIDCPVYNGNSGGIVIEKEQINSTTYVFNVIGVISQYIPFVQKWVNPSTGITNIEHHNSGYSVAVSMDKVFELINFKKK